MEQGTEEQQMIADTLAGVLASGGSWPALVAMGLPGLTFPEAQGGAGLGLADLIPALAVSGSAVARPPLTGGAILPGLVAGRIGLPGSAAVQDGSLRMAVVLPAAQHGLTLRGQRLSGTAEVVTGADVAGQLLICHPEFTALADCAAPGLTRQICQLVDGQGAADLRFDTCAVRILDAPAGFAAWLEDAAAWCCAAEALGAAQAIIELTRGHLNSRHQFGQPLARFQALRHAMADLCHDIGQFGALVGAGASALDSDAAPERRVQVVSALKRLLGTRIRRAAASAVQLHGGIGVTADYALNHHVKRILVADMLHGTAADHGARLAGLIAARARAEAGETA